MLVERSTDLESSSLSQMFLDSLINQTLSLLLLKLLVVVSNICLMFVSGIVLLTDRWRVMGQVGVAVITIIPRHRGGGRRRRQRRRRPEGEDLVSVASGIEADESSSEFLVPLKTLECAARNFRYSLWPKVGHHGPKAKNPKG